MPGPTLEDAIILAANAHKGQKDRNDEPYIMHPIRVMAQLWGYDERMVAVLHDVVEDTPVTLDDLRKAGYPDHIVGAVDAISRRKDAGESFSQYIQRVKKNPLATKVKIADLGDNCQPGPAAEGRGFRPEDGWTGTTGRCNISLIARDTEILID